MKKNRKLIIRGLVVLLLVASIMMGVTTPDTKATGYHASYIKELPDVKVNYQDYLDSSVVQALPSHVKPDDQLYVIVTLDEKNLLDSYEAGDKTMSFTEYALHSQDALQLRENLADQKAAFLKKLDDQKISYQVGDDYDVLLCGFELSVRAGDFEAIRKSLDKGSDIMVCEQYRVAETKLVENSVNVYDTGIFNSQDSGYDGTGMVVAVLDTGLDSSHSAFDVQNFTSNKLGLTYEQVAAVLNKTKAYELSGGLSVDDVYINQKVPFGYDYADKNSDVYSTHNNHGTHVSGIILGKDETITGVAPNAQLVSMKIFSDTMDTAISSWILSALEDCVVLNVDVINMSLGTACGFSRESDEEKLNGVYDRIREAGISVIVAASNSYSSAYGSEKNGNLGLTSNPDTGTVGSPGTYPGTLSVGSISGTKTPYILYNGTIIYFDESTNGASVENKFFDTLLGDAEKKVYDYVVIPGVGRSADYTGLDVAGKLVLVRRGDNTFEEKAKIAEAQGAAGIIIYNNVSGKIKMNVGNAKLAVCSIAQNDGELLAAAGSGKLTISKSQASGPFISDFSSWGPTPSLQIKPEITSFGGNILSSVTGGGYDRLSGTSMACPNLAGMVALLRQYVVENFPDIAGDSVAVNTMVNRLLMSTADIALNTNGMPYAVRKQGAGLANLNNVLATKAYIVTYDKNGNAMDTTKLELGDDPSKNGVYEMSFEVKNFGDKKLTYTIGGYVFTEGVSETKTNAGETTVTEEAYKLAAGVQVVSVEGASWGGGKLTVDGGASAKVTVKVALTDADKKYLTESFENGMYVEGYITLDNVTNGGIDLSVPYLAFFGDWTKAPLFDLTYFDTHADELDDAIPVEDKVMADAYATRPVGGVTEDFVSYLGTYYFLQDPKDIVISANKDYIALSNQDGSVHSLRFVWAGLLRNAAKIEVTITDDTTGEVVFEVVDTDVRKSYGDGGSIYPANVEIEFDTKEYNLANNSAYTVKLVGYLDYGDGGLTTNENNTFEFPLVMDFQAPTVTGVTYTYEYDDTLKKNRLYANVDIYDNHHAMSAQLGYVTKGKDEDGNEVSELKAFEQYMTPVYSQKNSTTTVQLELTDYLYDIKEGAINKNSFVVTCYDYALNYATYEIGLPDNYVDFYFDSLNEGLTLSVNEVYTLSPMVYPDTQWADLLEYTSSKPGVVRVVNNKLVAASAGKAVIKARDPKSGKSITFTVTVLKEGDEGYQYFDKPVADVFRLVGYTTQKAYYMVDSKDKDIGDTGDVRFFEGNFNLSMYPSESVLLTYDLDAYFPKDTMVEFETSNENIVTINQSGVVTAVAEGYASVTIKVTQDGRSTYYSESVSIEVKDPYVTAAGKLTHYYGLGGLVTIPNDLMLTGIGSFAFSNFDYVAKTEEELAIDDRETSKQWYLGDNTITKVIIPEGVEIIEAYAFANLTALEEVVLPSTLESIEYGAFVGCTNLKKVTFSSKNNLKIINQAAFKECGLEGKLDLSSACVISNYAFAGNKKLEAVVTSDSLLSIGEYAFAGCEKLKDVTITASKVKYGPYAFNGCKALESFYVNAAVLPEGMFYECENMTTVKIGAAVKDIGEFAFRDTAITTYEVETGNATYMVQSAAYILSADGKTLVAVTPTAEGTYTKDNCGGGEITALAKGAFSHNTMLTAVQLPQVTTIGNYAFGSSKRLSSVALGNLTNIGEYAFFETAITKLPAFTKDTKIGKYAFAFTKITQVNVPDGATVAEGVFSQCHELETVVIGNDVILDKFAFNMDKDTAFDVEEFHEDGNKYFRYSFSSALKNLTIGANADLGENAFAGHASLENVTLGDGAKIGKMAFYNCTSLKTIDLRKVTVIGDYAFSGDVYYVCLDSNMTVAAVSKEGTYIYTYHAPALESIQLDSAESIGEYAFAYCRDMVSATLNERITTIPQYAFAGCISLAQIDLSKVTTIGDYAFMECYALPAVNLSSATTIGEYAFVNDKVLASVVLSPAGCTIGEGAFSYCEKLAKVDNMKTVTDLGDYAFAYTAVTEADLSAAVNVGTGAFLKEKVTPFKVKLGTGLVTLGDNPFAMCIIQPFYVTETVEFNGVKFDTKNYNYTISDTVQIIDGSLYCKAPKGLELITYCNLNPENVQVPMGVVRVSAMAFAGTGVQRVTLPSTTFAIGHKAFYDCNSLKIVALGAYESPILEEEFDPAYYESFEHLPATGDLGTYTDWEGNEVQIIGEGIVPYFMYNSTDGLYSNVFYGANFVDYVGYVKNKPMLIRPVNGTLYDSFIMGQYFDLNAVVDGPQAPSKHTLNTIAAIDAIPDGVTYDQKHLVEYARELYNKIGSKEQQALVHNESKLISAEQRIASLAPQEQAPEAPKAPAAPKAEKTSGWAILGIILGIAALLAGAFFGVKFFLKKKAEKSNDQQAEPLEVAQTEETEETEAIEEIETVEEAEATEEIEAVEEAEATEEIEAVEETEVTEEPEITEQDEKPAKGLKALFARFKKAKKDNEATAVTEAEANAETEETVETEAEAEAEAEAEPAETEANPKEETAQAEKEEQ